MADAKVCLDWRECDPPFPSGGENGEDEADDISSEDDEQGVEETFEDAVATSDLDSEPSVILSEAMLGAVGELTRDVAMSLDDGMDLELSRSIDCVVEALRSEAAKQLVRLRSDSHHDDRWFPMRAALLEGLRREIQARPAVAARLMGDAVRGEFGDQLDVNIEVRKTAARRMSCGIFTVGSSRDNDVQVDGDADVPDVQLVVFALPKGAVVAAVRGRAEVVARGRCGREAMPVLGPSCSASLVISLQESVVLRLGAKSSLTLEPKLSAVPTARGGVVEKARRTGCAAAAEGGNSSVSTCEGSAGYRSLCDSSDSTLAGRSRSRSRSPRSRLGEADAAKLSTASEELLP
mmetsp:Transcript_5585/g.21067  ORF Transcript_5585/g.21067 Transcript_5585/m.21067 type:complete len:349 (+) Transcript_5585:95-1141(+)|eukprot:CAMPEP_0204208606 /NCGR_PEP_ID=MMETSP0361-20130328/72609_1 /ASSEMBLY_ACC=CAM_ASM_000343 /TAXON_ID=268821 /ORGANISM="Scrippsiella Hangoei, Strain SHTV-5" /LENGTH=348 /DNA_ID=CAMNT_0051172421 /DNA_START=73 /DNA_END=1119 /DNA_ORIENTATION=-